MKKFTSLIMALVLSLALAVPCFAASVPEQEVIRLEMGESYTDPETGIKYSLKRGSAAALTDETAAASAARLGPYYYVRGERVSAVETYTRTFTAQASRGDVVAVEVDASKSAGLDGERNTLVSLHAPDTYLGVVGIVPNGEFGVMEIDASSSYSDDGITGPIELELSRSPYLRVYYSLSQYWA